MISRQPPWRAIHPLCVCNDEFCLGRLYFCEVCFRMVPWCFGASDDMPEACDDCWAEAHKEAA